MKNKTAIVACICLLLIVTTLLAVNIRQEKIIQEQNKIIALQTEQIFNYQNTAAIQETYIKEQEEVLTVYQDIINLHELMTEVE